MKQQVISMSKIIYPINPPNSHLPILVMGIGYEDNQPHMQRKDGYPIHQIFICKSGEGTLRVNDKTHIIKKGSFFYLMANSPHEYYGNSDKWELRWISFSGNQIDDILTELKFDSNQLGVLSISNIDKMEASLKKIYISLKSEDISGKFIASSVLYEILVDMYTMIHSKQEDESSEGNSIINLIRLYIDEHYNQDMTLEELSDLANITPQYLCKLFKKHLGLRPFQYITMKRIQYAKNMLSDYTMSVNDIAHKVGFSDCSYFCAIFKRYEMVTPTQFRGL